MKRTLNITITKVRTRIIKSGYRDTEVDIAEAEKHSLSEPIDFIDADAPIVAAVTYGDSIHPVETTSLNTAVKTRA